MKVDKKEAQKFVESIDENTEALLFVKLSTLNEPEVRLLLDGMSYRFPVMLEKIKYLFNYFKII